MEPPEVVVVSFEEAFDEEAAYIDRHQVGRVDGFIWHTLMEDLQRRGLIKFTRRVLEPEVAKSFLGGDRYIDYAAYDRAEKASLERQIASLRQQAHELEEQAKRLEGTT